MVGAIDVVLGVAFASDFVNSVPLCVPLLSARTCDDWVSEHINGVLSGEDFSATSTALEKVLSFLKQYLQLWVLVAAEVTVAWQDLLASRIALTFARLQPTTCLLHKLLSLETLSLATLGLMI